MNPRKGHFRYESGHHGGLWLDLEPMYLRPKALEPLIQELAGKLAPYRADIVCGPMVEGALLAQSVANRLGVEFCWAEQTAAAPAEGLYATAYRIPGAVRPLLAGRRAAIIDDVINAGSAVRGAADDLLACGAVPVAAGALLVLGSLGLGHLRERSIPVEFLASVPFEIWAPPQCPLCAAGVRLEDLTIG
jgi:orotate phosphoribosyltransferase